MASLFKRLLGAIPSAVGFKCSEVPLAIPDGASTGYGTAIRGLSDRGEFLFAYLEGAASRLHRVHFQQGPSGTLKDARGLLRDLVQWERDRAWVLMTHALLEVTLEPFAIVRRITSGIGDYAWRLHTLVPHRKLLISARYSRMATVVDAQEPDLVRRLKVPSVDLVVPGECPTVLSFQYGIGQRYDANLRPQGPSVSLPIAATPVHRDGMIYCLPGKPVPVDNAHLDPKWHYDVRAFGQVIALDETLQKPRQGPRIAGLTGLTGFDHHGRLIGYSHSAVILVDPQSLEEVARHRMLIGSISELAQVMPSAVVGGGISDLSLPDTQFCVQWA